MACKPPVELDPATDLRWCSWGDHPAKVSEFPPDKASGGLKSYCRACKNKRDRASRRRHRTTRVANPLAPATQGPKPSTAEKPLLVVGLFDEHHDKGGSNNGAFWKAKLAWLADHQPDYVVLGGDFGECSSGSRHVGDAFKAAYEEDVEAMRTALRQVRAAVPAAKLVWAEGNHENALLRYLSTSASSLVKGFWERWARDLDLEQLGVEWVPEGKQPYAIGRLRIVHGHQDLRNQGPRYHAARMSDLHGTPGATLWYGHTHKPQAHVRPWHEDAGGPAYVYGVGCGRSLRPDWLGGSTAGWVNEFAVGYVRPGGVDTYLPRWQGSAFTWQGKVYR